MSEDLIARLLDRNAQLAANGETCLSWVVDVWIATQLERAQHRAAVPASQLCRGITPAQVDRALRRLANVGLVRKVKIGTRPTGGFLYGYEIAPARD